MRDKALLVLLATAVLSSVAAVLPLFPSPASASSLSPTITGVSPKEGPVATTVTISGTDLADATSVRFGRTQASVVADASSKIKVQVPSGARTSLIRVTTPEGIATSRGKFVVTGPPLAGVVSLVRDGNSSCAVLTSGGVDCWGFGRDGELGNGIFYNGNDNYGSAFPVAVLGVGGSGTLSDVVSLTATVYVDEAAAYCALLTTGGVDCWGYGTAVPEAVPAVGGSGTLGGVVSMASDDADGFCAVLTSGGVDCWGVGKSILTTAMPGVGGVGTLGGVASLAGVSTVYGSYCALLTAGGVDCWGYGYYGELGDGVFYDTNNMYGSADPVTVVGVDGNGTLGGVASLASSQDSYCAVLTSGGVDCWGFGYYGELGDGVFTTTTVPGGSDVPVAVLGLGGSGTLGGVASLASSGIYLGSYCALLSSRGVDCWGYGYYGQLGNGVEYTTGNKGSAVPVAVLAVGASGTLGGAVSLASSAGSRFATAGYCALLSSGGVDCWGYGKEGELGDGIFYRTGNESSVVPVTVLGVGASGALGSVASLVGSKQGFCALLTSGGVDCWGPGQYGQLGSGVPEVSAAPVAVVTAIT